jgi:cytochrome c-type biogenesis protein CcmH
MKKMKQLLLLLCLVPILSLAEDQSSDPAVEARLKLLSQELRCLVCQNQTLADSSAPLAEDLRNEIRQLMAKGMTDQEVTAYLVARYGNFVRYRPPVESSTLILWGGPTLLLVAGLGVLWVTLRRRNQLLFGEVGEGEEA